MYWMASKCALFKRDFEPSNTTQTRPSGKSPVYAMKHNPALTNGPHTHHTNSPAVP